MATLNHQRNICIALEELAALLENCGEMHWYKEVKKIQASPASEKYRNLRTWYGGMGSFNDLIISRFNGHTISEDHEEIANDKLSVLRTEIYNMIQLDP
ncbi:hypothetical protein SAMN05444141_1153 [Pseudovibrio denitrificans]|uniref:DUF6966 domain-containing protein n=1 Tax=Pseudovibrio denitrificans TaxID=258256 RepID=A0A1I7DZS8_9HYPH|nr:hypothetical protein [Pseudovibrio denitrificans]SFU17181.1 hypothetical protein SAMN05444141_1153 [Pseudovibrio denitrificans]